ncbi:MAG TPA: DinB family protein [Longilinea sp.]|nr:DinB family protein [Longilinea sp.]
METFYQEYIDRFQELHKEIMEILHGLPQEALDWVPGKDMNSMGAIVAHIAGSERMMVGTFVGGITIDRDREAEFRAKGAGEAALAALLDESLEMVRSVCSKLTLDDLAAKRVRPRDQLQITVTWALLRSLNHTAMHEGHIQITRQLWEQRK